MVDFIMKKHLVFAPLCLLMLSACTQNSPLLKGHENYVGTWQNNHSELVIKSSGEVTYYHQEHTEKSIANQTFSGAEQSRIKAHLSSFGDQSFSIGQDDVSQQFTIQRSPYQDDQGHWKMSINGENYTRK